MSVPEEKPLCPNCGSGPVETPYCPECGQRKLSPKDHKAGVLLKEFFIDFLQLDNSFFRTFRKFLVAPSVYLRDYLEGARKKYISPVKFFFIANAVYFLFPAINTFTTSLSIQEDGLIYSNLTDGLIRSAINASGLAYSEFSLLYNDLTTTLSKALLIFLPLMFGLISWLTSLRRRKELPLIHHLNYSLVLNAFLVMMVTSFLPGLYILIVSLIGNEAWLHLNNTRVTIFAMVAMNIYGIILYRGFFKSAFWINAIRTIVFNLSFYLLLMLYRLVLLLVTLSWILIFK